MLFMKSLVLQQRVENLILVGLIILKRRMNENTDGRDRTKAKIIGHYDSKSLRRDQLLNKMQ